MDTVANALGTTVPVIGVDADMHPDISKALGVKSFPTIIYYAPDGMYAFEGERSLDAILGHVCTHSSKGNYYKFCKNPLE